MSDATDHRPDFGRLSAADIEKVQTALRQILGHDRVSTGADVLVQHAHGESFHPDAAPDVVVWPKSVDEAAGVVRIAADLRVPLIPFGAGTSLEGQVAALAG